MIQRRKPIARNVPVKKGKLREPYRMYCLVDSLGCLREYTSGTVDKAVQCIFRTKIAAIAAKTPDELVACCIVIPT